MNHARDILELPATLQAKMTGVTWHEDLPSPSLAQLRLLRIPFVDFAGNEQLGELITQHELAPQVWDLFAELHAMGFPIHSIRAMHEFSGDDGNSMAANNSSCFNSRHIRGTDRLSLHALGRAVDINPVQNPVIRDGIVRPDAGQAYCDRTLDHAGMFTPECAATQVFLRAGWKWGGNWQTPKDYHHFFIGER